MTDAKTLRVLRLKKGLDLDVVAKALGVDPATLQAFEAGELEASERLRREWENVIRRARAPQQWWPGDDDEKGGDG
jgi:transcriptional regulator with XRE-family HTH domain